MSRSSVVVMERFTTQWSGWRLFAGLLPTPGAWRFARVMRRLNDYIYGVIRERRISRQDAGDLLSMLLLARDEAGQGMSDRQLRRNSFAMMEAVLVLATVAQNFRLTAAPGYAITPWPSITLQ